MHVVARLAGRAVGPVRDEEDEAGSTEHDAQVREHVVRERAGAREVADAVEQLREGRGEVDPVLEADEHPRVAVRQQLDPRLRLPQPRRRGVLVDVVHVVGLDVGVDGDLPVHGDRPLVVRDQVELALHVGELAEIRRHLAEEVLERLGLRDRS